MYCKGPEKNIKFSRRIKFLTKFEQKQKIVDEGRYINYFN